MSIKISISNETDGEAHISVSRESHSPPLYQKHCLSARECAERCVLTMHCDRISLF